MVLGALFSSARAALGLSGTASSPRMNTALNEVLDEEEPGLLGGQEAVMTDGTGEDALAEMDLLRQRAEADAQDKASRLRVAQEQMAEWAQQKERDAQQILDQCKALSQLLAQASGLPEHAAQQLQSLNQSLADNAAELAAFATQQRADVESLKRSSQQAGMETDDTDMKRHKEYGSTGNLAAAQGNGAHDDDDELDEPGTTSDADVDQGEPTTQHAHGSWAERARYIPMRLTQDERRLLRLLEAALSVSEYTDKVDILTWKNKTQRIHAQIKDMCAILCGLVVASDYKKGQQLIKERSFADNAAFFQCVFELGRRYKIMNPDKMRGTYGKLMYMLMDSADSHVQELLEFKCVAPLVTVAARLEDKGAGGLLTDPLLNTATAEISTRDRSRYDIQRDIKAKERARELLAKRYSNSRLSQDDVLTAIYSLSDNNSYLLFNRDPIDRMLMYFRHYFKPDSCEPEFSLAIQGGKGGARLTHNHERQYHFVLQSLMLWREISTDMFKLWYLAEQDMLHEGNSYRLCDTGQGLNRVQPAPAVAKAMQQILSRCQRALGGWVGSSVVHLGDHNVPSALIFIDKYTQVPRILNPVVLVLDELPAMCKDEDLRAYIDESFGGVEDCRKTIITDFCRHAFDGSGADNFFDAGSCIDGRLTSAWNWCSKLEKKRYYPIFKLAGFTGFDGDFK